MLRDMVAAALVVSSAACFALPNIRAPLDVPAPTDPHAAATRLVGVAPIDRAKGRFAAVGPWGKILVSDDAGSNWGQRPVPVSSDLTAVTFPTPRQGWAVGHDGVVLHSEDGGESWKRQLDGNRYGDLMVHYYEGLMPGGDPRIARALEDARRFHDEGADKPFLDVWFENENSGWLVGAFNLILKTDDGGKTWEPWIDRVDNEEAHTLFAIGNAGNEIFIVGELGLVLRLDRAQRRFVKANSPYAGSFFGLAGKPGTVVIYGLRGHAFRSRDTGRTWQSLSTGLSNGVTSGAFLDDGRLVLVDGDGSTIVSSDDGDHFIHAPRDAAALNGVTPLAGDHLVVVGERGARIVTVPAKRKGTQ